MPLSKENTHHTKIYNLCVALLRCWKLSPTDWFFFTKNPNVLMYPPLVSLMDSSGAKPVSQSRGSGCCLARRLMRGVCGGLWATLAGLLQEPKKPTFWGTPCWGMSGMCSVLRVPRKPIPWWRMGKAALQSSARSIQVRESSGDQDH